MAKKVFYRYLRSHGLETLQDGRFLVSQPSKFWHWERDDRGLSDPKECKPQLRGSFSQSAVRKVFPGIDEVRYSKIFKMNFNKEFAAADTLGFVRILCLCSPERRPDTDAYMWSTYADSFRGLRLGVEIEVEDDSMTSSDRDFIGQYVQYSDDSNVLNASTISDMTKLGDGAFDVIFKKDSRFIKESEYRLLMVIDEERKHCPNLIREGANAFWIFPKEIIVSLDIGVDMPKSKQEKLIQCCEEKYTLVRSPNVAIPHGEEVEYASVEL